MIIDNNKIILLQDKLDEAAMLYYEQKDGKLKYLDCLAAITKAFLNEEDLDNEEIVHILSELDQIDFNSEEVRQAILYLIIKGFKHQHLPLDTITPDRIGVICAHLIDALFEGKDKVYLMDLNLGTGNLVYTINNYSDLELYLMGIENNETMIKVAQIFSEMMMQDVQIYFQDALKDNFPQVDLVIADVDSDEYHSDTYESELTKLNINYFPYLLIEKHQYSGDEDTQFMFIVPNDFFSQKGSDEFKKAISENLEMVALIVLPETMFVDPSLAKSILIMQKQKQGEKRIPVSVFNLPSISDQEAFITMITEIKKELKERRFH